MEKEPIRLLCDGETVTADGTTLGGDDGIAVAYMLAILASDEIEHPALEAVFTVDEEIGMLGAAALDMTLLKGRRLLNIDSEDEGILLCGCAGGATIEGCVPVDTDTFIGEINTSKAAAPDAASEKGSKSIYSLTVDGLTGGHSGIEIDKGRANAIMLLGRILERLDSRLDIGLISVYGGGKDNVIPVFAEAFIVCDEDGLMPLVRELGSELKAEYDITDPGLSVSADLMTDTDEIIKKIYDVTDIDSIRPDGLPVMDQASKTRIIDMLRALPNGVQRMNPAMPERVQTSLNIGVIKTIYTFDDTDETSDREGEDEISDTPVNKLRCHVYISSLVRSDISSEKRELVDRVRRIITMCGGDMSVAGDYPGWRFDGRSELIEIMSEAFKAQYGYEPKVETVHAGVECGYFADALEGLDAVSFGPDLKGIHTPAETMNIESVERTWRLIIDTLKAQGRTT